jgi:hypothetical protein
MSKNSVLMLIDRHDFYELCDYSNIPRTNEAFLEEYELDGDMIMAKGDDWESDSIEDGDDTLTFICGPSIGDGYVSSSIRTDNYLQDICDELKLECEVGLCENMHMFHDLISIEDANHRYKVLKDRISKDFNIN